MVKILIADDHFLVREGFKKLISREIDMKVVAEAKNANEVLDLFDVTEFDVMVLDINMPGKNGLDLLKDLKHLNPKIKVLILSIQPEDRFAIRALKMGASGYITKESAPDELVKAIQKVHQGGKYVSQTLAERLAFDLDTAADKAPHERLSDREFQVFQLIGSGKSMNAICDELILSLSTVTTYRNRILEKMNMKSNAEIIHYAIKNHLVD
jgi:DNA-binding NarL/FixJ family response regulator